MYNKDKAVLANKKWRESNREKWNETNRLVQRNYYENNKEHKKRKVNGYYYLKKECQIFRNILL
jgi:hypothetical protein